MSLFEFSDISKSEETIQRTWEDFRSALATGVFSYNELDAAKANTTFLKVFDDLFSHCHPFFDISAESILACPTTLMRAGRLRPADPDPTYSRFIPNKDYITKHNRFSPPGVEWLYLAIGDPCVAETCALKECRAEAGELFGLCQFKLNEDYSEKTLVDLTIAEDVLYEDLNRQLENSADEIRNREVKKAVDSIMRKDMPKRQMSAILRRSLHGGQLILMQGCYQNRFLFLWKLKTKNSCIRLSSAWPNTFYLLDMRVSFIRAQYSRKEKMLFCSIKMLLPLWAR